MAQHIETLPELPIRPADGHKGTFGRVLIIAGSRGMSGAACLAGKAALRSGAGLVFLAVPKGILSIVAGYEPSYLTIPLSEDSNGCISQCDENNFEEHIETADVIACGPGLGQSEDLSKLVSWLYTKTSKPLILDADALNLLAKAPGLLEQYPGPESEIGPRILTPHPGEFCRLTNQSMEDVTKHRESLAIEFAQKNQVILVLKGRNTVITDGEKVAINTSGNSSLATGGSGDVLTGLIAALLGQGLSPFDAAHLGAYMHGVAAELASQELSEAGVISSDLPYFLARAWKKLAG